MYPSSCIASASHYIFYSKLCLSICAYFGNINLSMKVIVIQYESTNGHISDDK